MSYRHSVITRRLARVFICVLALAASAAAQFFETRGDIPVGGPPFEPESIAVGDFNGDGKLDLAAAPYLSSSQIVVFLGKGDGTFGQPAYYPVEDKPFSIATADLNGDHILDLVVANNLSASVSVLPGNGDGTFQSAGNFPLNGEPVFVAIGDFNNDHIPDIVVADSPYISVLLGNGDGTFGPAMDVPLSPQFPTAAAVGDFNHDGNLDIAATSFYGSGGEVSILLGRGDGTFSAPLIYDVGLAMDFVATSDLNQDGNLDLVVVDSIGSTVSVMLGNGDGTFGAAEGYFVNFPLAVAVADLNDDGKQDVVAGSTLLVTGGASVLLGKGDGTLRPPINYPVGKNSAWVAVGDFNGDRKPDIAVADSISSDIAVLLNTGVVSFSPTTPLEFPPQRIGTTSQPQTVTLTNRGSTSLVISATRVSGDFVLSSTCGVSVPPGGRCQLKVRFQPKGTGLRRGLVSVVDSTSSQPQVVEVFGEGTNSADDSK